MSRASTTPTERISEQCQISMRSDNAVRISMIRYRSIVLWFVVSGLSGCGWSQPAQPIEAANQNCAEPKKPLEHARIVQLAKSEIAKREPSAVTGEVGLRWSPELCGWDAVVELGPSGPGRHRDVVIANTGKVIFYLEGR